MAISAAFLGCFWLLSTGFGGEPESLGPDLLHEHETPLVQAAFNRSEHFTASDATEFVCSDSCCSCTTEQTQSYLSAGASIFFAKPHMKESFQANILDVTTGTSQLIPLDYDYQASPRLWVAYQGSNDLGLRLGYWKFDHQANQFSQAATATQFPSANATTVIFPATITTAAPGEVLLVDNSLKVQTIDLEGTVPIQLGSVQLQGTAGIRYASMRQSFNASASGVFPTRTLSSIRSFEGTGLTVGLEAQKSISSNFSLIGDVQGSLLFGEKTLARSVVGDVTPNSPPPNVLLNNADEVSGIFELGLGIQWNVPVTDQADFFLQGKYENSLWTAAGFPTLTFLGFDGFSATAGLVW
jgi:hypothetical protein